MLSRQSVLLCVLLVSWSFAHPRSKITHSKSAKTCMKSDCFQAASEVMKNMNFAVNPCDDFYQFACGGFFETAEIPPDWIDYAVQNKINDDIVQQLMTSLRKESPPNELRPLTMTKNFYKSCMDKYAIGILSKDSLLKIVKSLGGWPIVEGENWDGTRFNWKEAVHLLRKMGYIVQRLPRIDFRDLYPSDTKLYIDLHINKSFAIFEDSNDSDMVFIANEFGANGTHIFEDIEEMASFVKRLQPSIEKTSQKIRFKDLGSILPGTSWEKYIRDLIPPSLEISNDEMIFIESPTTLLSLEKLMDKTPKRVQANYIIWNIISQSVDILKEVNHADTSRFFDHNMENKRKKCFKVVSDRLPVGLSALYVHNHFQESQKNNSLQIFHNIYQQIRESIKQSEELEFPTRRAFLKKLKNMNLTVAYQNKFFNNTKFKKLYKDLNISASDSYLNNYLQVQAFGMRRNFSRLHTSLRNIDWQSSNFINKLTWDRLYDINRNAIVIPVAILQGVLNQLDNPQYMKYGAMGSVVGNGIISAFDRTNRNSDGNGNSLILDYPSKEFLDRNDQCFIDQYKSFSTQDTILNEVQCLESNFADNGGIKSAYLAYSLWSSKQTEPEPRLPGLESFSPKQMLWISHANMWCKKYRDQNYINPDDVHSPPKFRIIGSLSNIPEFAADFGCPVNSKMNPTDKCSTW